MVARVVILRGVGRTLCMRVQTIHARRFITVYTINQVEIYELYGCIFQKSRERKKTDSDNKQPIDTLTRVIKSTETSSWFSIIATQNCFHKTISLSVLFIFLVSQTLYYNYNLLLNRDLNVNRSSDISEYSFDVDHFLTEGLPS